jgi:hypothetical protein
MSAVIPTSSAGLIARAERALRTDQPNLARIYLEAADTAKHRERTDLLAEKAHLKLRKAFEDVRTQGNQIANGFFHMGQAFRDAERHVRHLAKVLAPLYTQGSK